MKKQYITPTKLPLLTSFFNPNIIHPLSRTHRKRRVFKFETTFIWLRAYLFEVLIIKGDLGGSWLSNSWPVVWGLLVSYKETNHPLIRIYHRRSWLKLSQHIKRNTQRIWGNFLLDGSSKCFHTEVRTKYLSSYWVWYQNIKKDCNTNKTSQHITCAWRSKQFCSLRFSLITHQL